jgi:exopolysaccharide production protein ExoZ
MKTIQNIQALRGIAVLLVVLFHLVIIEQKYGGSKTILPDFLKFGMFGVDLFFVISGFVMATITRGKFQNTNQAIRFLYHRVSRIYPTYWVYSFLVLGIFFFNPLLVNSSQGNEVNVLASFLLIPSETLPLVMVGWTLIHEMYFYLVLFFILLFNQEKNFYKAMLLWVVVVIVVDVTLELNSPLARLVFNPLTIEFVLGCFLAIHFYHENYKPFKGGLLLFVALVGFMAAIYGQNIYHHSTGYIDPEGWWRILIYGVPSLLIVFSCVNAERNGFVIHSSLITIGDASYSIYLSHVLTLSAAGRIWGIFSSDLSWGNYVIIVILLVLAILVGILSYRYVEKPLLTYSRKTA